MYLKKRWGCCLVLLFSITAACRNDSSGKASIPPPEQECRPGETGSKDAAAGLKEALLSEGQWVQDGERWKAQHAGAMIFKSITLFQEKPELLAAEGQTPEDKWTSFYEEAMQLKEGALTLAAAQKQSCP